MIGSQVHSGILPITIAINFTTTFFLTAKAKLEFLEQCVTWPCHGDPTFTYSDVERVVGARLRKSQIVACLTSQIAVERRRRELAFRNSRLAMSR
jgi:hypothetical protein